MYCVIPLVLLVSHSLALMTPDKPYYDLAKAEYYFAEFIQKFDKKYKSNEEYYKRLEIFTEALKDINENNEYQDATFDITEFSDLTPQEFKKGYLGFMPTKSKHRKVCDYTIQVKQEWIDEAPDSLDYRKQNLVTEVKNQRACGSCFVFSAIGNVEGQYAKKHKQLVSLSEQQGLDCNVAKYDNCRRGGFSINVLNTLVKAGGSVREEDYPYSAMKLRCRMKNKKIVAKVKGAYFVNTTTEEELKGALAHFGPLSVALHYPVKGHYRKGVWSPEDCNHEPNHAIVLVGYGTDEDSGKDYWLIKNSWGERYGEKGYFKLERGEGFCRIGEEDTVTAIVE